MDVVIPTFQRHEVLLQTIERILDLHPAPAEIIVVDQSSSHPEDVRSRLDELAVAGRIRWLRAPQPSIPAAMNLGLQAARSDVVLFVDDDVQPAGDLVLRHADAHGGAGIVAVAGQVLQPGERPAALVGQEFRFSSSVRQQVGEVIGCNFSVRRSAALSAGGFDERFVRVAYRFEADFCDRILQHGGAILFEPAASLRHLRAPAGGTRTWGSHLRTVYPFHAVGDYYYLLGARPRQGRIRKLFSRPVRAIATKHHLTHPWWIPLTLGAEALGFVWALTLAARGPRLLACPTGLPPGPQLAPSPAQPAPPSNGGDRASQPGRAN